MPQTIETAANNHHARADMPGDAIGPLTAARVRALQSDRLERPAALLMGRRLAPVPWSPAEIPDQSGRRAVVTGANSGLGLIAARELARKGAAVVLACRNQAKGAAALEQVRAAAPGVQAELARLDLGSLESVRAFAATQAAPLDLLLNNAGVMAPPRAETADGFELQLGTNHLGHFALTGLLLGALKAASSPRVVTISSNAHQLGRIDFDDLQSRRRYRRWRAYNQSKLANLLFVLELDRRARAAGRRTATRPAGCGRSPSRSPASRTRSSARRRRRGRRAARRGRAGRS